MADNAYWFSRVAWAVRDIVDEHGGAIIMTRPELCEAVREEDPCLEECPPQVMNTISKHITCCLKRANVACCAYQGVDASVLLIFDNKLSEKAARDHAESDELSEEVQIAIFERQLTEVTA